MPINERGMGERADAGTEPRLSMINSRRISVVLRAYNTEVALLRTVAEADREVIDDIVLADDASRDQTVPVVWQIGLAPTCHESNKGYGGNRNSGDFVFDNQVIAQAVTAGARIGEVSCPPRHAETPEACVRPAT